MKKLFFLALIGIMPMSCDRSIVDSGTFGTQGNNLTWTLTKDGVLTISGSGEMGDFIFPWYLYQDDIKTVVIKDGVTNIGNWAFYNHSNLTSAIIGNSVTEIGYRAFDDCVGLTSVIIGNGVTKIRMKAFYGCRKLTSVIIPDNVIEIGIQAFQNCYGLTSVTIGNSVTTIEGFAFRDCGSLTSVIIPNSVTGIGYGAFYDCHRLTSVTIGSGVLWISNEVFEGCRNLTSVICYALTPPDLNGNAGFFRINNTIILYVPAESIELYQQAKGWSYLFPTILAIETNLKNNIN